MSSTEIVRIREMAERQLKAVTLLRDQNLGRFVCLVNLLDSLEQDLYSALRNEILDELLRDSTGADSVGESNSSEVAMTMA